MNGVRFALIASRAQSRSEWVDKARRTEAEGFDVLAVPDHHDRQLAPFPALVLAAEATSLRVATCVLNLDIRHPVTVAKEAATADLLSDGRLELGVGAGWDAKEYRMAGMRFDPPLDRLARLAEGVRVVKALFADGSTTMAGEHYSIVEAEGWPKPRQRPHPPLFVGGGGRRVLELAAAEADIVGLSARFDRTGSPVASTLTADAAARKVGWIEAAAATRDAAPPERNALVFRAVVTDRGAVAAAEIGAELGLPGAEVEASPHFLVGTAAQIADDLAAYRDRFGITYYTGFERDREALTAVVAAAR